MRVVLLLFLAVAIRPAYSEVERREITRAYVEDLARKRAGQAYQARPVELPPVLRDLSYDDYQRIHFLPEKALWKTDRLPFQLQFFHLGGLHRTPVMVHEFTSTHVQQIPFVRTFFDYQNLPIPARLPGSLEYAGFRLLHPEEKGGEGEVAAFLDTDYFRALATGQRYGLSARGIAINAGGPQKEEFPEFVEFWLRKPAAGDRSLTFFSLLDGPSVAGVYTFTVTPGDETIVEVHGTCFFRSRVENLGLAPLSSMFWFGENSANRFGDFRSEVHDSDGLIVAPDAGTRLWRPLRNPAAQRTSDFPAGAPAGFGLLQRDREYRNYEDTEARYERRPSVWVEPVGKWPEGRVRLVEIPTRDEYADNIVAFWSPLHPVEAGQSVDFSYRLHWTNAAVFGGPPGWVRATRQALQVDRSKRSKFVVDFVSPELKEAPAKAAVSVDAPDLPQGKIVSRTVFRNDIDGSWRMVLVLDPLEVTTPIELRARLLLGGKPVTETWVGEWEP